MQTLPEASGQLTTIIAEHLGDAHDLMPSTDGRRAALATQLLVWLESAAHRARSVGALNEALASWDAALARATDEGTVNRIRLAAATVASTAAQFERTLAYTEPFAAARPDDRGGEAELVVAMLTQRSKALRYTGRVQQARVLLEPWSTVLDELSAAAGSGLLRELAAGLHQLGQLAEAGPIAERAVRLAEASADPELIVLALNVFANGCDDGGMPRVAVAVYRAAADFARAKHLLVPLNTVLGNLAGVELHQDPSAGIRSSREAIELATRIGHAHSAVGAALNLAEMLRCTGQWDEVLALLQLPAIAGALSAGVIEMEGIMTNIALVALARGDRTDLPRFARPDGQHHDGYEAVLVPFRDAIVTAFDDGSAAFDLAKGALRRSYERHGLAAYFTLMWPVAVDWAVESGRLAEARDLLALVTRADPGHVTSVLRVGAVRLQAFISAADPGSDPAEVENALVEAIGALADVGFEPDAARTRAVLARWLTARGREDEAVAYRAAAAATFDGLGATAWAEAPAV